MLAVQPAMQKAADAGAVDNDDDDDESRCGGGYNVVEKADFLVALPQRRHVHTPTITITITNTMRVFSAPYTRNRTRRHYNSDRVCVW